MPISKFADITYSTKGTKIMIDESSTIDSFVKIKAVGGNGDIIIGKNTYINSGTVIFSGNGVRIGNNVLISPNCTLAPVNHEYMSKDKLIVEQRFKPSKGGIIIYDDVWIGANSTILDGSIIKNGVVIGAQSLVKGILEEYTVYAGNPIRMINKRT